MFELWGIRRDYFQREIGGSFEPEDTRELLATFSTEALARAYVKSSELIKDNNASFSIQQRNQPIADCPLSLLTRASGDIV